MLKVWDAYTGAERATLLGHEARVTSCAISPDGSFVVSGSKDGTLRVWDTRPAAERAVLAGGGEDWVSCAISPDGAYVASACGPWLKLWDAQTWDLWGNVRQETEWIGLCVISPDGSLVALGSDDGTLRVWDVLNGGESVPPRQHEDYVRACAFSPDGAWIASASGNAVRVWDARTGEERATLRQGVAVEALAVSPDGALIVSGGPQGALIVWDVASGGKRATLRGHGDFVSSCVVSPDAHFVVSGSWDSTVRIWDAGTGEQIALIPLLGDVSSVAVHPWRPLVAAVGWTGELNLIDLDGVELGPIVVTAIDRGGGPVVRCPVCFVEHASHGWLGQVVACPTAGCALSLRVNSSVVIHRGGSPRTGEAYGRRSRGGRCGPSA